MNTLLFYDIETSGLSKTFDQVIEFAAIRTTMEFAEIERVHFYVQLTRDTVPSPGAFITHRITTAKLAEGLPEHEAINRIHKILNTPGTISLGYNTLGFDDEFLRFSFFRCLLTPYTHQYLNSCARMDLYPLVILYSLYNPAVMKWPHINDKPSMKLEEIAKANNWLTGQAHHAMTDVEATLSLAKALASSNAMWQYALGYFNKQLDWQRTCDSCPVVLQDFIQHCYQGVLISGKFGYANNFTVPALCFGQHKHYKNQIVWLRLDSLSLADISSDLGRTSAVIIRKQLAQAPIVLPWREQYLQHISAQRLAIVAENLIFLQNNSTLLLDIYEYAINDQYAEVAGVDIDACLYLQDFPSRATVDVCRDLCNSLAENADTSLLASIKDEVTHKRAVRYIWRFYPQLMTAELEEQISHYLQGYLNGSSEIIDFKGGYKLTPQQVYLSIKELQKKDLDKQQQQILIDLIAYVQEKFAP